MEDTPNMVMIIILCMIVIGIGLFIMVVFTTNAGIESTSTENFGVSNPSVALTVDLKYIPKDTPTIMQYNGIEWLSVDSSFISYSGNHLTIAAGGLQG